MTVSDNLVVRSEPRVAADSLMYKPWLPLGTELTVLGGPVPGSGYAWYEVAPVSFVGLGSPGFGWVAAAGRDGEPWLGLPATTAAREPPITLPPKPTGVTFDERVQELAGDAATGWTPRYELTYTVTWRSPRSESVTIRVYGVTECLSMPTPAPEDAGGPCLVEDTWLPSSALRLVATAPASAGTASWTAEVQAECGWGPAIGPDGTSFSSVVLAAFSASGHSIFAIAVPGSWCTGCIVC